MKNTEFSVRIIIENGTAKVVTACSLEGCVITAQSVRIGEVAEYVEERLARAICLHKECVNPNNLFEAA